MDEGTEELAGEQTFRESEAMNPESFSTLQSDATTESNENDKRGNALQKGGGQHVNIKDGLFSAYQSKAMTDVAAAEDDFMEHDETRFEEIKAHTSMAAEAARVAKLKNAEALTEVKHWSSLQDRIHEEYTAATDCLNKAELLISRETDLSSHVASTLKQKLQIRLHAAAAQPKLAENLLSHVEELRNRVQERERHAEELIQAASRLEAAAAKKVTFIDELTKRKAHDQTTVEMYKQESQQLYILAETDFKAAEKKTIQLERREVEPSMHKETYTQARVLAERAAVKANGAKLALQAAQNAGERVKKVTSMMTQTKRDVALLLRRAQELVSYADALTQGTDALRDQAYEKSKEADILLSMQASEQRGNKQLNGKLQGEGDAKLQSTFQKLEGLAKECGDDAETMLKEGKKRMLVGLQLQREVDMIMEHVPRVLHDAEIARQHEEEALTRVRELSEGVLVDAERRMEEEWAKLDKMTRCINNLHYLR